MKKIIPFLLILFFAMSSCKEDTVTTTEPADEPIVIENLKLNEKTKWKANIETTDGIREMQKILSEFEETEKLKDYKKLARKLNKVNKQILKQCSMEGEAHNNLHAYLTPIFKYLKILKKTKSVPEAKKTVYNFKRHLKEYFEYFE